VHEYLIERNPSAADKVAADIRRTIKRLQEMPSLGKATDEVGVRVIIEPDHRYRVFYKVDAHDVFVIRILHARQGSGSH
jgi:plasmid stabilization system protein ParE